MAAGGRQGRGAGGFLRCRGAFVIDAATHLSGPASPRAPQPRPTVLVLGGGPAGVGAALLLARSGKAEVLALERQGRVGGNSGSFELDGVHCDYGSHRLHAATEPHVMAVIEDAVGDDLIWRPRHGRILLKGRWIHFPLRPLDLIGKLPKRFAAALAFDAISKPFRRKTPGAETFATVIRDGLGPAISENFYYPYVRKLWALPPEELSVTLARRRVSGNSIGKIVAKILRQVPGLRGKRTGGYFYPRRGFGEISEAMRSKAEEAGAAFELDASVLAIEHRDGKVCAVRWQKDGVVHRREADAVWSTLPITTLVRLLEPAAPAAILAAAARIRFRGLLLIYLVVEQDRFTEYDAHYFPELAVPIARLSEPKNYSAATEPQGVTVLCAELPADPGDAHWSLSDEELGSRVAGWLDEVGLPIRSKIRGSVTRRLAFAYPVYDRAFEPNFELIDRFVAGMRGLLTFGRQGLFAHDNTHHALATAHAAVDCLQRDGSFDAGKWQAYRRVFATHVVED